MWGRTHLARKTIFLKALKVYSAGGTTNLIASAEMLKRHTESNKRKLKKKNE